MLGAFARDISMISRALALGTDPFVDGDGVWSHLPRELDGRSRLRLKLDRDIEELGENMEADVKVLRLSVGQCDIYKVVVKIRTCGAPESYHRFELRREATAGTACRC
jgi:hypothetical protein